MFLYISAKYYSLCIHKMESVWANSCRNVFASSTPTSKVTSNRCAETDLGVGIRFINIIFEALGSYNEDTRYQDT